MTARPRALTRAAAIIAPLLGALPLVVLPAGPATAAASSYYVDKTAQGCSDQGPGSASKPFCSLTTGVSALSPGATLYVGNGSYAETAKPPSGTSSARVTITGWPGRQPVVGPGATNGVYLSKRSFVTISGLTVSGTLGPGILVNGGSNNVISDSEVRDSGSPVRGETGVGIYLKATTDSQVLGNNVHHNSDSGIYLSSGATRNTVADNVSTANARGWQRSANGVDVVSPGNTVLRNRTYSNEDSGIQFYTGANNNVAMLNVSYNNGDHGIDDLNVTGGRLIGNTIFHNCTSGINVEGTSGNYVVENNIAVDNAVYPAYAGIACKRRNGNIGIWDSAPPSTVVDHNLVWLTTSGTMYTFGSRYSSLAAMQAATGQESHGVQADPGFANAAGWDLRLAPTSPAIDRGDSAAPGELATDIVGAARVDDPWTPNTFATGPRAYDDLGAYEFQPSQHPAQAPSASLSVSPGAGSAPVTVTADASGSSDPQGQALSYRFDFADGPGTGTQSSPQATHTYTAAGSYPVTVTVTNLAGLSSTATRTVTVGAPDPTPRPPTAALSLTPTSGTAPVAVTANASGSSDPHGQALTYRFDFADGTVAGPQSSSQATHTYTVGGSYLVTVTVTNTDGLSDTAQQTLTVTAPPPAPPSYVNRIATKTSTSTRTTGEIAVYRAAGVQAGDLVVLTLHLTGTAPSGTISGVDDAGNGYTLARDATDAAGNRLAVLSGVATAPLAPGMSIHVTFPTATSYRLVGDEFAGVTAVDQTTSATGTTASYSSGDGATTSVPGELAFGAVAVISGSGNPRWAPAWHDLGSYGLNGNYVGRADEFPTGRGTFPAQGTVTAAWLAVSVTFRP